MPAITRPPRTDDELWEFVATVWGIEIPRLRICPGHVAPFEAFADAYFGRHRVAVWKASRGYGGKSYMLSALGLTEQVALGADVTILGGSGAQSARVHEYMRTAWRFESAPRSLLAEEPTLRETRLTNGGHVIALMASEAQVRGPHPQKLLLDECLASGTLVLTPNGEVPIETLSSGDVVYSWHEDHVTEGHVAQLLYRGFRKTVRIVLADGRTFYTTPEHPILTDGGWTSAKETAHATVFGMRRTHPRRQTWQTAMHEMLSYVGVQRRRSSVQLWSAKEHNLRDLRSVLQRAARIAQKALCGLRSIGQCRGRQTLPSMSSQVDGHLECFTLDRGRTHRERQANQSPRTGRAPIAHRNGLEVAAIRARRWINCRPDGWKDRNRSLWRFLARWPGATGQRSQTTPQIEACRLPCHHTPVDGTAVLVYPIEIIAVEPGPTLPVWDISIPDYHTFIASGVVVHNCDEMTLSILDAALGQPMSKAGIPAGTVLSSTHHHPDGTMTEIMRRAMEKGWPRWEWCYKESLQPHGWLEPSEVEAKRSDVTAAMFAIEYDLQEPSPEGRAILPEAVEAMFQAPLGEYMGGDGEAIELEAPVPGGVYGHGADWAKAQDYTVVVTIRADVTPWRVVAFQRIRRRPWPQMVAILDRRIARYGGRAAHDGTGLGSVVADLLEHPADDLVLVGRERSDLFNEYISTIERRELISPKIASMYGEHKYCAVDDLYGAGHPPDTFVAGALARHVLAEKSSFETWKQVTEEQIASNEAAAVAALPGNLRRPVVPAVPEPPAAAPRQVPTGSEQPPSAEELRSRGFTRRKRSSESGPPAAG